MTTIQTRAETALEIDAADSGSVGHAGAAASPAATAAAVPSLRTRAIRGSIWTIAGHGAKYGLRLAGSLVLTRVLFPEVFGLMALVYVVLRGLEMFSDVGVRGSVIRDKRGDEPAFLNTAWTINAVRGVALWGCASLLAWPAARLYGEPLLALMIPVAGLSSVLRGFSSIAVLTCQRHVQVRPLVLRDVVGGLLGLIVTVALAIQLRSVWALVWGNVVGAAIGTALTYVMLPGPRPRLQWDRSATTEMYRFGRWIFISTALTFLLQQGDKAILGALIEPQVLGLYAIAVLLSRAPLQVLLAINSRVLFPVYSRIANDRPETLRHKLRQARMRLLVLFLPPLWILVLLGQQVIDLLYDPRYAAAGWMVQWLAAGTLAAVIATTTGSVLLATGDSFRFMLLQIWRGGVLLVGMAVGYHLAALPGLVAGLSIAKFADYPVLAWAVRRHGVWMPRFDAAAYGLSILVIVCGLLFMR